MAMKLAVPDKISPSYFVAEAAVELGFFKAEGLDVSLELVYPVDKAYAALRDGAIDFVGGAAHAVASAFPGFQGAKLIAAQAQGMYWFLVMRADLGARRGDLSVVKGKTIGAAPWVNTGLRGLLTAAGIDFEVANLTAPLERIIQSFRSTSRGIVRIETVASAQCSWFPYRAHGAA